jgi:hypothetical protein
MSSHGREPRLFAADWPAAGAERLLGGRWEQHGRGVEMEHRYHARMPVRMAVDVYIRKRHLGRFETRNIDLEGLFVEGKTSELRQNDVVELVFPGGAALRGRPRLHAAVVRCDADGFGMMLLDHDDGMLDLIRDSRRAAAG